MSEVLRTAQYTIGRPKLSEVLDDKSPHDS